MAKGEWDGGKRGQSGGSGEEEGEQKRSDGETVVGREWVTRLDQGDRERGQLEGVTRRGDGERR